MSVRAKKELGQHFLVDLSVAQAVADAVPIGVCNNVLEVGPGMGVLTRFLLQRPGVELTVVELDTESVAYLNQHLGAELAGRIVSGDFLRWEFTEPTHVVGNFPYNISTQIFFHVLAYRDLVPSATGMLQKEVAQRLAAPAGTRDGGVLSVLLQAFYDVEYLFEVGPEKFSPPPKVESAVIRCVRNARTELGCSEEWFRRVVKGAFSQRRKKLRNALWATFPGLKQAGGHEFYDKRAENLTVEDFIELTNWIQKQLGDA